MPITDNSLELTEVPLKELTLPEIFDALLDEEVLIVTGYEATRGKDILVRLDRRRYDVTQISFEVAPIEYGKRYWSLHEVSVNALSVHDVYLYDEGLYSLSHEYSPNAIVYFDNGTTDMQVAIIDKVYTDVADNIYYTLDNELGYFTEEELTSTVI